jgi:mono/diheme cytochrome c family protein
MIGKPIAAQFLRRGAAVRTLLRWSGYALAALLILALGAAGFVYAASERTARTVYDVPLNVIAVPADSAAIAEGRRLALIRGCYDGCHGKGADGGVFFDQPMLARLVAPNLTRIVAEQSDTELERVIRQGVRPNGRSTIGMPSAMYYHLTDEDLGAIIAFLRSLPPTDGPATVISLGPLARLGVVLGQYEPQVRMIDRSVPRARAHQLDDTVAHGRYLALTSCTECHGGDLRGSRDGGTPTLAIAAAYSPDAFARLMRTGIALGDRELTLMASVARGRFSHFTEGELTALHAYLKTLAAADTQPRLERPTDP